MPYADPEKQRQFKRDWARMRRVGSVATGPQVPEPVRLQTARDVLAQLEEAMAAVRGESSAGTLEKARVIGYLAGVALKAVEAKDLSARVEALEDVLRIRPGP